MDELKPCPFCGGDASIFVLKKRFKSIIVCTTPECGFMRHSYNNGDTDENAARRLIAAWNRRTNNFTQGYGDALETVENEPTADVEEVVRCKNCKYCEKFIDDFGVAKYFCVYFCGSQETEQDGYCHRGRKNEQVH